MKTIVVKNCKTCPYSRARMGLFENRIACVKTGNSVKKLVIPEDCPLNDYKFTAYTFRVNGEVIRYYTDKKISYDEWYKFIKSVKECEEINSLSIWECFNKTIDECGINMIFPISEECFNFAK